MKMTRNVFTALLAILCSPYASSGIAETATEFKLADGLTIEQVADESLIRWPVVADWDQYGRLVVVESGGVGWPIQEHNMKRLHRIVRLVDEDHDGKFDRRIIAADRLPFAEGVLCLGDHMLVGAPPNIWKLSDNDGDGVCEEREIWFDGQTVTNCANDLHGPYLGRDGWIYWCKGAFGEQFHELTNGKTLRDRAAHIYRRSPSGGPIESVISGGMDNPVEMAMTPEGEKFFTSTFLQHPGDGKRDGIGHAVYGSVFGKDHAVISDLRRTGPLMPIMTHLGPAAPSGLICLRSNEVAAVDTDEPSRILLSAQFNLHKVASHRLSPQGASFSTVDADILSTERVDFHPTDVVEDADGSVLVLDTGGWYDLCCPTSRVDQKVAPGGIYRISRKNRRVDAAKELPRVKWAEIKAEELVDRLSDPRPWVRRSAKLRLNETSKDVLELLAAQVDNAELPVERRLDALWGLSSITGSENGGVESSESLQIVLCAMREGQDESLVSAACQILSLHRYEPASETLLSWLQNPNTSRIKQRLAAEALGRVGEGLRMVENSDRERIQSWVDGIMKCVADFESDQATEDPIWWHAMVWALIELGEGKSLAQYLDKPKEGLTAAVLSKQQAALTALYALGDDSLSATTILEAMELSPKLQAAVKHILRANPHWADDSKKVLQRWWEQRTLDQLSAAIYVWRREPTIEQLVANWILQSEWNFEELSRLLSIWNGEQIPDSVVDALAGVIGKTNSDNHAVVDLLTQFDWSACRSADFVCAVKRQLEIESDFESRLKWLTCLPAGTETIADELFKELSEQLEFVLLARMKLNSTQAKQLLPHLEQSSSNQLTNILTAIASAESKELDQVVLGKLLNLATAKTLPESFLANLYRSRSQELRKEVQTVSAQLLEPTADVKQSVQKTLSELSLLEGDAVRGLQVFRSEKASCSACHQMGYVGGRIGPELTRIGSSRTREALLEAMLFPSSRIEQSYQPWSILTDDGRILNGIVESEQNQSLVLRLSATKTVLLDSEAIQLRKASETSIMPTGLREVLTPQELADLLLLLENAK